MVKKHNSRKQKIHIKMGDRVKIISGKNKGQIGKVIKISPKIGKIVIKDINSITKHLKPKREGETGKIIKIEAPIHSSNVKIHN